VGTKAERRAARDSVSAYQEAQLADLIEIDAYTVDETIQHYRRCAGELWKFYWSGGGGTHIEMIAGLLDQMAAGGETINWWEKVTRPQRD
jgi:hypothetical protein